jgi:hypothetical protein
MWCSGGEGEVRPLDEPLRRNEPRENGEADSLSAMVLVVHLGVQADIRWRGRNMRHCLGSSLES